MRPRPDTPGPHLSQRGAACAGPRAVETAPPPSGASPSAPVPYSATHRATPCLSNSGFIPLPIDHEHVVMAGRLPLIHRDPFDRILIAQARCANLTLVTRDPYCQKYELDVLAV
ncbi:type II toxin-antitoxin system VapC family toxin [Nocardia amamiensis]|uniref:type II toxin-antitoxin system VapC family toxin n=1 Tax=Nocardia amamiensis TaxID=404578 RepID=UPI002B4AE2C4|nr:type II toxin-antitoxin system VapC family toxin [Nocardia amamiensis]